MDITTYKDALDKAKKDLATRTHALAVAQEQAAEAERDIVELRQTIAALAKLCGESEFVEEDALGITDAVRLAFKTEQSKNSLYGLGGNGLSAHDVRAKLESMGYAGRWGNVLASIHTVIKRLADMGELEAAGNINGRDTYIWKEHPMRAAFGRPRSNKAFYGELDPDKLPDGVRGVVGRPKKK
jgi:hypothetical protein